MRKEMPGLELPWDFTSTVIFIHFLLLFLSRITPFPKLCTVIPKVHWRVRKNQQPKGLRCFHAIELFRLALFSQKALETCAVHFPTVANILQKNGKTIGNSCRWEWLPQTQFVCCMPSCKRDKCLGWLPTSKVSGEGRVNRSGKQCRVMESVQPSSLNKPAPHL